MSLHAHTRTASPRAGKISFPHFSFAWRYHLPRFAKVVAFVFMSLAICFLAVWMVGIRFASYQIGDQHVRVNASDAQIKQAVDKAIAGYKFRIQYPGGASKTFAISDAGLKVDEQATVQSLRAGPKQNPFEWWKPVPAGVELSVNQAKLASFITQNATVLISKPSNASIKVSNGTVSLTDAKLGKEYGISNAAETIKNHISSLNNRPLTMVELPVDPDITDAKTAAAAAKVKTITNEHIAIKISSKTVVPSSKDIAKWLSIKVNKKTNTVDVVANSAAINDYFTSLVYANSQVHRDKVIVTLANGATTVAADGQDGIYVSNQTPAENFVKRNLLKGNDFNASLDANLIPYNTVTAADWPKWIEVNLTTQRMYVYENGKTLRTFLVSTGKPSTPTPIGTFYIWQKLTLQTMIGADYVQPNVPWINYFDHNADAIHGNYWQPSSVFGNYGTSHGCVGMPVSDAYWVFNWAPVGTPVVIHS